MDERDQSLEGALVPLSPFEQQPSDFRLVVSNLDILCPFSLFSFQSLFPLSKQRGKRDDEQNTYGVSALVLAGGLAACNGASPSSPTATTSIPPPQTPRPNGHGEYVVDVTLSGVVFEMTPAGGRPIEGVQSPMPPAPISASSWSAERRAGHRCRHEIGGRDSESRSGEEPIV
jgi:hypothetical protein